MHRLALLFGAICFVLAGGGAYFIATLATDYLEDQSEAELVEGLQAAGQDWVNVRADGWEIYLQGLAPDEESRFKAIEITGKLVNPGRVSESISVERKLEIAAPRFSVELLRNEDSVSLIGLIPEATGRAKILQSIQEIEARMSITDMLETVSYPQSAAWEEALYFGLESLQELPRSKISITKDRVLITAVTNSENQRRNIERSLREKKPDGLSLLLDISAPRSVISPFSFRLEINEDQIDLISCSADTKATSAKILSALQELGLAAEKSCDIGLGVPTTDWAQAVILSSQALRDLGGGTVTISDSDISLVAADDTESAVYDQVVGRLENELPELFSMLAFLPPKITDGQSDDTTEVPEFIAIKGPEGLVQLRGRVTNQQSRKAIEAYANSLFGGENVYVQARLDDGLPKGWPIRVLGGMEAVALLHHGTLTVLPDEAIVKGVTADPKARAEISRVLARRLGGKGKYSIDVTFDKSLYVVKSDPTPEECDQAIDAILERENIQFAPASTIIEAESQGTIKKIADVLRQCPTAKFEVGGHTDSQGREELNLAISQRRAEAIISALSSHRILVSGLSAVGYGPNFPIADNGTEEGRAQNRRIEFNLQKEAELSDAQTVASATSQDTAATDDADAGAQDQEDSEDGQN